MILNLLTAPLKFSSMLNVVKNMTAYKEYIFKLHGVIASENSEFKWLDKELISQI
jgi:hypothetical protein